MKDGGPAFPQPNQAHPDNPEPDGGPGMSLRDWFAGQALAGAMANPKTPAALERLKDNNQAREFLAALAYDAADALLKQREEQE